MEKFKILIGSNIKDSRLTECEGRRLNINGHQCAIVKRIIKIGNNDVVEHSIIDLETGYTVVSFDSYHNSSSIFNRILCLAEISNDKYQAAQEKVIKQLKRKKIRIPVNRLED